MHAAITTAIAVTGLLLAGAAHAQDAYPTGTSEPLYAAACLNDTGSEAFPTCNGPRVQIHPGVLSTAAAGDSDAYAALAGPATTGQPAPSRRMTTATRITPG